ncbi:hypothetical protein [Persephonella sp.]
MKKILVIFILLLVSCSPKYRVIKEYSPLPNTECLDKCVKNFNKCQYTCNDKYIHCLNNAISKAEKIYQKLSAEYEKRYEKYLREYRFYEKRLKNYRENINKYVEMLKIYEKFCLKYKDPEACSMKKILKKEIKKLSTKKPEKPEKPIKITLEKVIEDQQSYCNKNCGCHEIFDACYQACGGNIEIKKICVENCD